jgi:DNA-binding GntR family transcriptional regulator
MTRISHRQRIHDTLRSRILRGEIGPDHRLIDTALAAEMGVSRMPVREALLQLVNEGYLEGTTRGFTLPRLGADRVAEIFLLRRLLEPRAAAGAAQALTPADLARLRQAVAESTATLDSGDFEAFFRASELFRNTWLLAVPNSELRAAILRYSGQVQSVRLATMRDRQAHGVIVQGHHDLLDCFARRDALAAADRILQFVIDAENSYARLRADRAAPPRGADGII